MKRVIILNAPPGSGKDELTKILCRILDAKHHEFKKALYVEAFTYYGIEGSDYTCFIDRDLKEAPDPRFGMISPRQGLIHVSEDVIKPKHGKDYFAIRAAMELTNGWNVFSDGGFNEETTCIADYIGPENLHIVQFSREGYSFEGDSRSYVDTPEGVNSIFLENDSTLEDLAAKVLTWLSVL